MNALAKFESCVSPEPMSGCWLWAAGCTNRGYGAFTLNVNGKHLHIIAHKFAWEYEHGPVPVGLELDHLCRVRSCVNPRHLEPVTRRTNLLRGQTIPAWHASKTHCPHGHPYDSENTTYFRNMRRCRTCNKGWCKARYRARKQREEASDPI